MIIFNMSVSTEHGWKDYEINYWPLWLILTLV